jgi:hypothetical protein
MMCAVLAENTASASTSGHRWSTSSSIGFTLHMRMPSRCSARSLACHARCGRAAEKKAACCPVPEPISRTFRLSRKTLFSTARIGSRLRSQASEYGFIRRVDANAAPPAT